MKKTLALFIAVALLVTLALPVSAASVGAYYTDEVATVSPGDFVDKDGNSPGYVTEEDYSVNYSFSGVGAKHVKSCYIGDDAVVIEFDPSVATTAEESKIVGQITLRTKTTPYVTYICKLANDDLLVKAYSASNVVNDGGGNYSLPTSYNSSNISFGNVSGSGTLNARFGSAGYMTVPVTSSQGNLFLGHNTTANIDVMKAHSNVTTLRFVNFSGAPKFISTANIGLYVNSGEYVYGINNDGSLYNLGGSTSGGVYTFSATALGSYVFSPTALAATGTAAQPSGGNTIAPDGTVNKNPNTGVCGYAGYGVMPLLKISNV